MSTCIPNQKQEVFATVLSSGLTVALVLSFVSQHYKIISKGKSIGFSPWFLVLGSTSSAMAMLDIWTLQWYLVKCCRHVSASTCVMSIGGILQVTLQWMLFNITFILVMLYFPSGMKYVGLDPDHLAVDYKPTRTREWRDLLICTWLTIAHFLLSFLYTSYLIVSAQSDPNSDGDIHSDPQVAAWATFLGASSAAAAVIQYLPQLWRTWTFGFVGALSIPMYCFQVPGAAIMVISIAIRKGTDWTSWAMYAASGTMAGALLILCLAWKTRQKRLGVDDFGRPISLESQSGTLTNVDEDGGEVTVHACIRAEETTSLLGRADTSDAGS